MQDQAETIPTVHGVLFTFSLLAEHLLSPSPHSLLNHADGLQEESLVINIYSCLGSRDF